MADREKVIKTIDGCINDDSFCNKCDYEGCVFQYGSCEKDLLADALALLKEQDYTINELQNAYEYLQKQFFEVQDKLLNEQEAVEPRRDANCVRMFRCGVCGEYVGFIDSDPGDPNEQDNYCRNCGQKVKWNE